MEKMHYRNLVGFTHTEEQAKAEAAAVTVTEYDRIPYLRNGEPDENGKPWQRPGKLFDHFPSPYPNEKAARAANNGALPPDFSVLAMARHGGIDYIFSLLTGYDQEPPAGVTLGPGKYWNPYFPGGVIGMTAPLADEQVEFDDGTPATVAQMAKDVCNFMHYSAEPYMEDAKKMAIPAFCALSIAGLGIGYGKRHIWNILKTQKVTWKLPKDAPL